MPGAVGGVLGQAVSRAVSATDSLIGPMRGWAELAASCGHGRVAERDLQVSVGYVPGSAVPMSRPASGLAY